MSTFCSCSFSPGPSSFWAKTSPATMGVTYKYFLCWCRCVITGVGGTSYAYLGRPWGPFGRVVYAYTYMDACIKHVGWDNLGKTEDERSACFYEYRYITFSASSNFIEPTCKTHRISFTNWKLLLNCELSWSNPAVRGLSEFGWYHDVIIIYNRFEMITFFLCWVEMKMKMNW